MKKLIAYSSVAHMGIVTIGAFTFNQHGIEGSIFQMLSHGVVSGALFLCVGVVYDRMHTREIDAYGGLVHRMPGYAVIFMFFTMASVGLPGTGGFVGEILALLGAFEANTWVAFFAATGLILGAAYALYLYRRNHVKCERLKLKAKIQRQHVGRRYHRHHAKCGKQDQDREFEPRHVFAFGVIHRHHDTNRRTDQDHHLGEFGKGICRELAIERHPAVTQNHQHKGDDLGCNRKP